MAPRRDNERTRRDFSSIAASVVIAGLIMIALMMIVPMIASLY